MKIDNQATGFMRTVMACATQICGVVAIKYRFIRFIVYVSRALASVPDHLERLDLLWLIRRDKRQASAIGFLARSSAERVLRSHGPSKVTPLYWLAPPAPGAGSDETVIPS